MRDQLLITIFTLQIFVDNKIIKYELNLFFVWLLSQGIIQRQHKLYFERMIWKIHRKIGHAIFCKRSHKIDKMVNISLL